MNKKLVTAALLSTAILALAGGKDKDPVLMTIDGRDIRLSEFEYLYNKNNSQQAEPVTFEQYVDMFIDYKLKVADARACGVDTTQEYKKELAKFVDDLAKPYLTDSLVAEQQVVDVYNRMGEEVYVSHIMFALPGPQNPNGKEFADSIRNLIATGQISYEDAARQYSRDTPSAKKGGRMGWVTGNSQYPYQFEEACYNTPVGQISEVVNSGVGLHIIRPEERRPASGEVHVQHILVLTRDLDEAGQAAAKEKIDSIYEVVISGADFGEVAKHESQDPGSAQNGGDLGWFGIGRMVPEFEATSFALSDGEISKPFPTSYGYHIIKKLEHRGGGLPPFESVRDQIKRRIDDDARSHAPIQAYVDKLSQQTGSSINPNVANIVAGIVSECGVEVCDSAAMDAIKACSAVAYTINGKNKTIGEVIEKYPVRVGLSGASTGNAVKGAVDFAYEKEMLEYGKEHLAEINPEFRNLMNEYRDGMMLFDISNQKVWKRATDDKEGLEAYFQAHRNDYKWDIPRYKAYVIFAKNDSIADEAKAYIAENFDPASFDPKKFSSELRKKFGSKDIRIEHVVTAKGENPYIDFLGFGGPEPSNENSRWGAYFDFAAKVIDAPEEAADVKGQVTTDYQAYLEREWLDKLHSTYKVKVNKKTLKEAAKNSSK